MHKDLARNVRVRLLRNETQGFERAFDLFSALVLYRKRSIEQKKITGNRLWVIDIVLRSNTYLPRIDLAK